MLNNFAGNKKLIDMLSLALNTARIPHAIIIEGEGGSGKKVVAKELAKAIMCKQGNYCNTCRSCHLFDVNTNGDFISIKPERNLISVDTVRGIKKTVYSSPDISAKKVYLIEHAEKMNIEAQNAFLKILEEPPEYVVFILLTSSKSALLNTIVSRCTVYSVAVPEFQEAFSAVKQLNPQCDDATITAVLKANTNNIGRALDSLSSGGETAKDAEDILKNLSYHNSYQITKILYKYNWDVGGFNELLNILSTRVGTELRLIELGEETTVELSRNDLIGITNSITKAEQYLQKNCMLDLVINCFASSLS